LRQHQLTAQASATSAAAAGQHRQASCRGAPGRLHSRAVCHHLHWPSPAHVCTCRPTANHTLVRTLLLRWQRADRRVVPQQQCLFADKVRLQETAVFAAAAAALAGPTSPLHASTLLWWCCGVSPAPPWQLCGRMTWAACWRVACRLQWLSAWCPPACCQQWEPKR
jgi:hypothetical protein